MKIAFWLMLAAVCSAQVLRPAQAKFSCRAPDGWTKLGESGFDRAGKVHGVTFIGPRSGGVAAKISLRYYPPGNKIFATAGDFWKANPEKTQRLTLAGLPARSARRKDEQYLPADSADPQSVVVSEEVFVAESRAGFYVIEYSAPEALAAEQRPVFQRVLDSFRPE